jgi:hypothetical protein
MVNGARCHDFGMAKSSKSFVLSINQIENILYFVAESIVAMPQIVDNDLT